MLNRELEPVPYGFRVMPISEAVPAARRRIVAAVRDWRLGITEEAMRDVELLSSEVIANAVEHTGATCAVYVRWTGTRVRVEVTDVDPGLPKPEKANLEEETGRGLLLVSSLSAAWGTETDPTGKVVWFEIEPGAALVGDIRPAEPVGVTTTLGPGNPLLLRVSA